MLRRSVLACVLASTGLCAQATDLVVIVHPAAGALDKDQVSDIFLGRAPRSIPLDLAADSPLRAEFYQRATGRDLPQVKMVWSRVLFTGKGLAPRAYASSAEVKKVVADNPRAVGYIEKSAVDTSVKVAFELP